MGRIMPIPLRKNGPSSQGKLPSQTNPNVPSRNKGVNTPKSSPGFVSPVPIGPSANSIKEMQQALINLGSVMSKNYALKNTAKEQVNNGADAFGRFLVDSYMNQQESTGQQFVNVDLHEKTRSDTAMGNKSLPGVVTNLLRVGTPGANGGEKVPDGIWQTRTDNALKEATSLAASLLQLSKDMGMSVKNFSDQDLNKLNELVPSKYTELKGTGETRAQAIAPYLKKIISFYQDFEKVILNNPKFKPLISQEVPFKALKKIDTVSDEEQSFLTQNLNTKIPNVNFNGRPVTLQNISSLDNFKKFLIDNNIHVKDNELNKYIDYMKKSLETGFDPGAGY